MIKVGIDYDEPIFRWYDNAHEVSVAAGLARAEDSPPTSWDPHSTYGCTLEEWVEVLDAEVDKGLDGMYGRPVIPESVTAIRRLYSLGYEIHLITARGSFGAKGERIKELTRQQVIRAGIPNDGLHFAHDKVPICQELGIDYFIDDRPKYYEDLTKAGIACYLLDAPWNQDMDVPVFKRVSNLTDFTNRVVLHHGDQNRLTNAQRQHVLPLSLW